MNGPPINLFSRRIDPDGVRRLVIAEFPDAEVVEDGGGWSAISIGRKGGLFKRAKTLRIQHSPEYYTGSNWGTQRAGMSNYFLQCPLDDERGETLQSVIGEFQFSLAFVTDPPVSPGDDDFRYELMLKIAKHLDACFFVPGHLLDSEGRVLVSANGEIDADARFPLVENSSSKSQGRADADGIKDDEADPPTAARVAARMLVLAAVSARGLIELNASEQGADLADLESTREEVIAWCEELGIDEEFEPDERRVLETPLGALEERDHLDSIWRFEGLSVLAWALGLAPLPAYDEVVKPDTILPVVGFLNIAAGSTVLRQPDLRSSSELETYSKQQFAYHWRLTNFRIKPEGMDFKEFGKTSWFGPLDLSWARFKKSDLALGDLAILNADADLLGTCTSIAAERHLASNWLCGQSRIYSKVDTST